MLIKLFCFCTLSIALFLFEIPSCFYLGLEIGTSSIDSAQLSSFHLKKETESSLGNVVLQIKGGWWIICRSTMVVFYNGSNEEINCMIACGNRSYRSELPKCSSGNFKIYFSCIYVQCDSKLLSGFSWPINLKPKTENKTSYGIWKCNSKSFIY
jgi:hypothetical protein